MCQYVIARAWRRSVSLSLAEHCSNVDETVSQFFEWQNIIQPIGKLVIPINTSLVRTDTSRRKTAELTTNRKTAVTVPRSLSFDT